jgi:hypothetical protein
MLGCPAPAPPPAPGPLGPSHSVLWRFLQAFASALNLFSTQVGVGSSWLHFNGRYPSLLNPWWCDDFSSGPNIFFFSFLIFIGHLLLIINEASSRAGCVGSGVTIKSN